MLLALYLVLGAPGRARRDEHGGDEWGPCSEVFRKFFSRIIGLGLPFGVSREAFCIIGKTIGPSRR